MNCPMKTKLMRPFIPILIFTPVGSSWVGRSPILYKAIILVIEDAHSDYEYTMYFYEKPSEIYVRECFAKYQHEFIWKVLIRKTRMRSK